MKYTGRSGKTYLITEKTCVILSEATEGFEKRLLWKAALPNGNILFTQISALRDEAFEKDDEGVPFDPGLEENFLELTAKEADLVLEELLKGRK